LFGCTTKTPTIIILLTETHCKKTAEHVIDVLAKQGLLKADTASNSDLHDVFNTPMGTKLLATSNTPEHALFSVNVCGSGHVFVAEKSNKNNNPVWRIFQSWQNEFTLAQWLGVQKWVSANFKNDFNEYGNGKMLTREQLTKFISQQVAVCGERMQQFRDLMLAVPYELEVTSFIVAGK
jgi:hypothetical protein